MTLIQKEDYTELISNCLQRIHTECMCMLHWKKELYFKNLKDNLGF